MRAGEDQLAQSSLRTGPQRQRGKQGPALVLQNVDLHQRPQNCLRRQIHLRWYLCAVWTCNWPYSTASSTTLLSLEASCSISIFVRHWMNIPNISFSSLWIALLPASFLFQPNISIFQAMTFALQGSYATDFRFFDNFLKDHCILSVAFEAVVVFAQHSLHTFSFCAERMLRVTPTR